MKTTIKELHLLEGGIINRTYDFTTANNGAEDIYREGNQYIIEKSDRTEKIPAENVEKLTEKEVKK